MSEIEKRFNSIQEVEPDTCEMLKRIVLAWDADFTKLTPDEAKRLEIGRKQLLAGEFYRADEIDWNNLDKMNLS